MRAGHKLLRWSHGHGRRAHERTAAPAVRHRVHHPPRGDRGLPARVDPSPDHRRAAASAALSPEPEPQLPLLRFPVPFQVADSEWTRAFGLCWSLCCYAI